VDEIADHFVCREVVEQPQHALEQQTVLAAAELLRNDDAGMGAADCLPLFVERRKIADIVK